jgi:hypothetical protein
MDLRFENLQASPVHFKPPGGRKIKRQQNKLYDNGLVIVV